MAGSNLGKWNAFYLKQIGPVRFGDDDVTYRKAGAFLADLATVEDWGCGAGWFRQYLPPSVQYRGVDGSRSPYADAIVDLATYASDVDGILLRHVLEHNDDWRSVLANAVRSFRKKLVIVLFTPFSEATRILVRYEEMDIPDLSFCKSDLIPFLQGFRWHLEEGIRTKTQYGVEHIFFIEKLESPQRPSLSER